MAIKKVSPPGRVIIVGAGPSGLILGLLLAKQGIEVEFLDAGAYLDEQPRAAHYATPAAYELARAGVLDEVKAVGIQCKSFAWRKMDTTFIAGMKHDVLPADYPYSMVVLPLDRLGKVLYEHIQKQPTATVKWSHRVARIGQDQDKAWVDVETPNGTTRSAADYVIGCDGASSTVRRELFGPEFPGETLNAQIIATNVYYDFSRYGYWDSNFIVHPKNWYMAARITTDGLYRVSYGDTPGLTREEYIARQPQRYAEILPGNPKPGDYKITNISPYKLQQRGGLGLTGGIADVGCLYDSLIGIHNGLADESILDIYSAVRKRIWTEIIDPMSRDNFRRLHDQDPDSARENDEFFQMLLKAESDEELAKELALGLEVLRHDMTRYYTDFADGAKL
ncbi:uncharacterized protein N7482_008246 [Penicillium canariense]|uniref:FAD-binding domain-containing protein n=1 Tax=Penicillium canariense TaxID=189055 RepID=A0A9W9HW75_9EURO|nr:uncharacterized protein N7482_008246 [Penicillium canariense]KAJ5157146.1 hypothetical protein N7482_008246 [Penicillium canariense]